MLYLIREEWAVHQCADANKYVPEHRQAMTRVAGNPYSTGVDSLFVGDTHLFIQYCPFCGCSLKDEVLSDDELPTRYIHPMWR